MEGKAQNELGFFAKFPRLSNMQTLSHKLLIRQTSNYHHSKSACPKTYTQGFSSDFWADLPCQKQLCFYIFKEQI